MVDDSTVSGLSTEATTIGDADVMYIDVGPGSNAKISGSSIKSVMTAEAPVQSVAGRTGAVVLDGADIASGTLPAARLPNTIAAAGPVGDATHVPQITFDAHGRLTAVASVAISGGSSGGTPGGSNTQVQYNNNGAFGGNPGFTWDGTTVAGTAIKGKLTTETPFTAGAITETGYLTLYDSTGKAYRVNAAPAPTSTTTTVDDSVLGTGLNQFNYTGASWARCAGVAQCGPDSTYNNSNSWASTTGDSVLFKFTGTQVKFYGVNDVNNQKIGLSICDQNGANCSTEVVVDQYAATRQGNVLQWTSPVQTSGTYTLKARVTGQHNASAVADGGLYYAVVDRIDVVS